MNKAKENKSIDVYITNIISTIREFNWKINKIWVENNCILADVKKIDNRVEEEGLYAGNEFDLDETYRVFNKLRYILNFNGMLSDDNIRI